MIAKNYFGVNYTWSEAGQPRYGRTVITARTQQEAEAKFARLYHHAKVVPTFAPSSVPAREIGEPAVGRILAPLSPARSRPAAAGKRKPRGPDSCRGCSAITHGAK
jgi:hypothetical protein